MISNIWLSVNFGASQGGLATVGYRLYKDDGTDSVARTTTGVIEITTSSGNYGAVIPSVPNDAVGIEWDTGGGSPVYHSDSLAHIKSSYNSEFEDGAIWVDQLYGSATGTGHSTDPMTNFDTAVGVALANGLRRIRLVGFGYYQLGVDIPDFQVISDSPLGYNFIDFGLNVNDLTGAFFKGVGVWKNNGGDITFSQYSAEDCNLFSPMDDITGVFIRCFFLGVITTSKYQIVDGLPTIFIDCAAGTPGQKLFGKGSYVAPRFSLKSIQSPTPWSQEVVFQRYAGEIAFEGMDHADSWVDVNMAGGKVTLDADNTLGTYRISGIAELVDNSGAGCTVIDNRGSLDTDMQTVATDTGSLVTDMQTVVDDVAEIKIDADFVAKMTEGRWLINRSTNQIIFYEADNATEVARFDLRDADGNPTFDQVFERRRV